MKNVRIFYLLQRAHAALFRAADRKIRETAGITSSQQGVLFLLSSQDGAPISAIADELKMGNSSLTGLVDRMSAMGLVRRGSDPEDGRVQKVFIEPAGADIATRMRAPVHRMNARLLEPFSADERKTIARFLTHITENAAAIVDDAPGLERKKA